MVAMEELAVDQRPCLLYTSGFELTHMPPEDGITFVLCPAQICDNPEKLIFGKGFTVKFCE